MNGNGFRQRNGNASDAIAAILNPHMGYREELKKKGMTPKDYERQNKKQLKQLQQQKKEEKKKEERTRPQAFKLSKFKTVAPRVYDYEYENHARNNDEAPETPKKHEFLRRGSGPGSVGRRKPPTPPVEKAPMPTPPPPCPKSTRRMHLKAPTPSLEELERRNAELAKLKRKEKVDYVNANAWQVIKTSPPKPFVPQDDTIHRNFGRVPKYLLDRQEQWAREDEERRRNLPDPDCPPGMMRLDEDERLKTLDVLRKSLVEARQQLNALPLRIETPSQIRRKNALEAKLQEIEDAIKVFDKPKVYVAMHDAALEQKQQDHTGNAVAA